jgi:serine/threonine-protein kinase RsbT
MGDETSSQSVEISRDIDAIWCSRQASRFAQEMGFRFNESWEIAISVSELTTNVLKFAKTGVLTFCRVESPRLGVEITVEDEGPGISDIEAALIDGYSEGRLLAEEKWIRERHGLGTGLGAVRRLMDELEIENKPEGGVRVTAHKWLTE